MVDRLQAAPHVSTPLEPAMSTSNITLTFQQPVALEGRAEPPTTITTEVHVTCGSRQFIAHLPARDYKAVLNFLSDALTSTPEP